VEQATGLLQQGPFDLVVTDYILASDLDGLLLLEHLQRSAGPPAILISGSRQPEPATLARQHGAFAFFQKPFELKDLPAICRLFLHRDSGDSNSCSRAIGSMRSACSDRVCASSRCSHEAPGKRAEPCDMSRISSSCTSTIAPYTSRCGNLDQPDRRLSCRSETCERYVTLSMGMND